MCIVLKLNPCRSGKSVEDNNTVSMVLERHDEDMYLFALNRTGQLRVWCCSKFQCVREYDFSIHGQLSFSGTRLLYNSSAQLGKLINDHFSF